MQNIKRYILNRHLAFSNFEFVVLKWFEKYFHVVFDIEKYTTKKERKIVSFLIVPFRKKVDLQLLQAGRSQVLK